MILRDFNTKVGTANTSNIIGAFDLGEQNEKEQD